MNDLNDDIIGRPIREIDTPALLIDMGSLSHNIQAMQKLCSGHSVKLRPHAKTHKSSKIAHIQQAAGALGVCCAKLGEAESLVSAGITSVMITTPLTTKPKFARLAALLPSANVIVIADSIAAIAPLNDVAESTGCILDVVVEVDVGQARCGVPPGPAAAVIAQKISRNRHLRFAGLQGYQGRLQGLCSYQERREGVMQALARLQDSADHVIRAGLDVPLLTGGGSGSLAIDLELGGLTELQPGSYVFMDASYLKIHWDSAGSPPPFRSALSVLASVVSRPTPERAIVDCGWKSLSCDSGPPVVKHDEDLIFEFAGDEHGTIRNRHFKTLNLSLGDSIELVPSHCDTTVNLHDTYVLMRDGHVEGSWTVSARGRTR